MKTLVMDTSNNYLAIAFYKDDKLIDQCKIEALKKQSELAIPMMQKMLGSVSLKDIDEMIREGKEIEVKCHFCNMGYHFSVEELKHLLKKAKKK